MGPSPASRGVQGVPPPSPSPLPPFRGPLLSCLGAPCAAQAGPAPLLGRARPVTRPCTRCGGVMRSHPRGKGYVPPSSRCRLGCGRVTRSHPRGKGPVPPSWWYWHLTRPARAYMGGQVVRFPWLPARLARACLWLLAKSPTPLGLWHEGRGAPRQALSGDLSQGQQGFRRAAPGAFNPVGGWLLCCGGRGGDLWSLWTSGPR